MSRLKLFLIIIGIFGIIIGVVGIGDTIKIMNEDFESIDDAQMEAFEIGDLAKGNIYAAYDQVAVEKTTRRYGVIPMGSSETPYYLVNVGDHYGVLAVGNKDLQSQLDHLADATWDAIDNDTQITASPVEVSTKVIAMPDKVRTYLHDYCMEWGMSEDDYLSYVDESCVLNCVQYDSIKIVPFVGFGVGVVFIVIFIIVMVKSRKSF